MNFYITFKAICRFNPLFISITMVASLFCDMSADTFHNNLYCSHSAVVHHKLVSLQNEGSGIFPAVIIILVPPPLTWRWKLRSCDHRLCPTVTGLVSSPLCVLDKYCLCRRAIALPFCVNSFLAPLTNS